MTDKKEKKVAGDQDPISQMLAEASQIKHIKSSLSISHFAVGARVAYKISGVDESYVKLSGDFMGIAKGVAFFGNLEGVFNVKHKIRPRMPIVVIYGNQAYLMIVIGLKSQRLMLAATPIKVVKTSDLRKEPRYECNIDALMRIDHRGLNREKAVNIVNLSNSGCCISMQQSQDEGATGLSTGKRIVLLFELKLKKMKLEFPAIVRNLRKDPTNTLKKKVGVEFVDLSQDALDTIGGLTATLKQIRNKQE